jgi:hypothetical protein
MFDIVGSSYIFPACTSCRRYGLNIKHRLNTRQTVGAVFQVLCSLYGLTCVGYRQKSLQFVSCSLIHAVGPFAEIGDSNDKCSSSLEVQC